VLLEFLREGSWSPASALHKVVGQTRPVANELTQRLIKGRLSAITPHNADMAETIEPDAFPIVQLRQTRWASGRGLATRGPAELRASHEVLEFVRDKPGLSLRVMQLRDAGMSWLRVQEVLKAAQVKDVLEARSTGGAWPA
jgi:hypothetical protein